MNQLTFQMKAIMNQVIEKVVNRILTDIQKNAQKSPKSSKSNEATETFDSQNFHNSTENVMTNEYDR